MSLIERKIMTVLRQAMKSPEVIVITGMRRVGKTSLMKMLFNELKSTNKLFLDFENILDRRIFEETDYNRIINGLKAAGLGDEKNAYVFIDELQNYPASVSGIKYLYDHYNIKFIVTGSSSFYLRNLFPDSLSGRKSIFELFPLDFEEFLKFKGINATFEPLLSKKSRNKNKTRHQKLAPFVDEYLEWGGFPQLSLTDDTSYKKRLIADIFSSYYQKDTVQLSDFRNMNAFRDLLMLLIQRTGSKLDISKLASDVGISRDTVYSYLSFLEATYMITLVKPYSQNPGREISGASKVYFCDNAILTVFGKVSLGNLFENAVFCHFRSKGKVNYYQKRTGHEIDFILSEKKVAVEVKTRWNEIDYNKVNQAASLLKLKESYLVTLEYHEEEHCIPFNVL